MMKWSLAIAAMILSACQPVDRGLLFAQWQVSVSASQCDDPRVIRSKVFPGGIGASKAAWYSACSDGSQHRCYGSNLRT